VNLGIDLQSTQLIMDLGIKYFFDGLEVSVEQLEAENDQFMQQTHFDYTGGPDPHYSIDRINNIDASVLYRSEDGIPRMFYYEGSNYRTVSSTIVFGALSDDDSLNLKAFMMGEIVNYFLGISPITSLKDDLSGALRSIRNFPNPFSGSTTIEYTLTATERVLIDVYDLNGKIVRHLVNNEQSAGEYHITWDANNDSGESVNGGYYFYSITVGGFTTSEKMVLLH
jgi:hypothetical protein